MPRLRAALPLAALAVLAAGPASARAQQYFGQNHVQYDQFRWRVLETEHFQVHFYDGLERTASIAGAMAERTYARLSRVLGHEFREKKPIVVFASRTDFAQNNIFGDLGEATGGVTDWLRQRNTLYFIGDYGEFDHILAHEMVHVFQYDIFSRGRAGANVQSIARVAPPYWFMEGMAEYLSVGPNHAQTNAVMRDAALHGRIPSIEELERRPDLYFPYRYGASLWEYVGSRWGDAVVGDVMNAVPSVGIERAFRRELGMSLVQLGDEWREAVQVAQLPQVAERERARRFAEPLLDEERTGGASGNYVAPALSPDGSRIAFLSAGSYLRGEVFPDLYLADTETGERVARLTKSTFNADYEELRTGYSQAAFSPDGKHLAFTTQRAGKDILVLLDVARREAVRSYDDLDLEQMIGPSFSPDGGRIAFIGATGERSDVFVMNVDGSGLRRLTDDLYGDAQPAWSPDGRRIAFATERGPQSDLATLRFGKWRIAVHDLETGRTEVLAGQDGRNLNPQWSPDSRSIAYVSDRTGIANLFLYELEAGEHYQLTDVFGAISSYTEISPVITWAREADRLAFVNYDDGDYTVWWISDPRRLKRAPFRAAAPAVVANAGAATDTSLGIADTAATTATAPAPAPAPRTVLDSGRTRLSVYRAPRGLRLSAEADPVGREAAGAAMTVAALLDSASLALPDTSTFRVSDYRAGFRPEFVSQPTIGFGQDSYYGSQVYGATTIVLSDLLGNHRLAVAGALNGRLSDAQLFVGYVNYANRLQYALGLSQTPFAFYAGGVATPHPDGTADVAQQFVRYTYREASGTAVFPRNRFARVEFGARVVNLDQDLFTFEYQLDAAGRQVGRATVSREGGEPSATMVSPFAAYVGDNTLMGYTAPIFGRRFRVQAGPTLGSWRYMEGLADYRRYDPILFNVLTVATRVQVVGRVGRDEDAFYPNVLYPQQIRGYDRQYFDGQSCAGRDEMQCVSFEELSGSRTALANAELRFPVVRRLDLGFLPITLPPLDGHLFYDAGVAWSRGQRVEFASRQSADPAVRTLLTSWGAGFRLNLFGFAILRMDYVIPLATPERRGHWSWVLGGYGF